ncbi:hypothetical protein Trydic_g9681 [Trypoxylus dichotomus]
MKLSTSQVTGKSVPMENQEANKQLLAPATVHMNNVFLRRRVYYLTTLLKLFLKRMQILLPRESNYKEVNMLRLDEYDDNNE